MKGFARGLALKQRHKVSRKWPISFAGENMRLREKSAIREQMALLRANHVATDRQ